MAEIEAEDDDDDDDVQRLRWVFIVDVDVDLDVIHAVTDDLLLSESKSANKGNNETADARTGIGSDGVNILLFAMVLSFLACCCLYYFSANSLCLLRMRT